MLAEKVHIKALTIAQRVQLLQDGLNDRSGKVFIFQINFSIVFLTLLLHYVTLSPSAMLVQA